MKNYPKAETNIKLRMEMGNVPKRQQPDHRKKTTAEVHQQVFNVAKNSRTRRRLSVVYFHLIPNIQSL